MQLQASATPLRIQNCMLCVLFIEWQDSRPFPKTNLFLFPRSARIYLLFIRTTWLIRYTPGKYEVAMFYELVSPDRRPARRLSSP